MTIVIYLLIGAALRDLSGFFWRRIRFGKRHIMSQESNPPRRIILDGVDLITAFHCLFQFGAKPLQRVDVALNDLKFLEQFEELPAISKDRFMEVLLQRLTINTALAPVEMTDFMVTEIKFAMNVVSLADSGAQKLINQSIRYANSEGDRLH